MDVDPIGLLRFDTFGKISNIYLDVGFIRVIGKGNKERLVPLGTKAAEQIKLYKDYTRSHVTIKTGNDVTLKFDLKLTK